MIATCSHGCSINTWGKAYINDQLQLDWLTSKIDTLEVLERELSGICLIEQHVSGASSILVECHLLELSSVYPMVHTYNLRECNPGQL